MTKTSPRLTAKNEEVVPLTPVETPVSKISSSCGVTNLGSFFLIIQYLNVLIADETNVSSYPLKLLD